MQPDDLSYQNLAQLLSQQIYRGRAQSASFLAWFLENIFRLDEVASADAICDSPNDKGVDAIYVDEDASEIVLFQSKVRQNDARQVGDASIREFAGALQQFDTQAKIERLIAQGGDSELSKLLIRTRTGDLVGEGYRVVGTFVTNGNINADGIEAARALEIRLFDRNSIADNFVEITAPSGVAGSARFDVSDMGFIEFNAGGEAKLFLITAKAADLLRLGGLADGTLFSQNVRLALGSTKVNKDIAKTIAAREKHIFFPMYHNGVTIICENVEHLEDDEVLEISNYVVVNGAQSLTALHSGRTKVTDDLRLVVKIIEIRDNNALSRDITLFSNNQNAIKPRDLRSNHLLQTRLKEEFEQIDFGGMRYEIKRGEMAGEHAISNEEAGRQLLAFDLEEPWSCHQIYKVFDEKYTDIFGRPAVTAWRIILLAKIMERIERALPEIRSDAVARYRLTKYFLLYAVSKIVRDDPAAARLFEDPEAILTDAPLATLVLDSVEGICRRLCVDLRFEFVESQNPPDHRALLKSPVRVPELEQKLRKSFEHDVARGRETRLSAAFAAD